MNTWILYLLWVCACMLYCNYAGKEIQPKRQRESWKPFIILTKAKGWGPVLLACLCLAPNFCWLFCVNESKMKFLMFFSWCMQSTHMASQQITEETVYLCTGNPLPQDVQQITHWLLNESFAESYKRMYNFRLWFDCLL